MISLAMVGTRKRNPAYDRGNTTEFPPPSYLDVVYKIVINSRKRYDEKSIAFIFPFPSKSPRPDSGRYGNGGRQCRPQ